MVAMHEVANDPWLDRIEGRFDRLEARMDEFERAMVWSAITLFCAICTGPIGVGILVAVRA